MENYPYIIPFTPSYLEHCSCIGQCKVFRHTYVSLREIMSYGILKNQLNSSFKVRFLEFRRYHIFANLFSKLTEITFYTEISKF